MGRESERDSKVNLIKRGLTYQILFSKFYNDHINVYIVIFILSEIVVVFFLENNSPLISLNLKC